MTPVQILAYALLGACAYGLIKGLLINIYEDLSINNYNWITEFGCIMLAISGPAGYLLSLMSTLVGMLVRGYELRLCYKMPSEFWVKPGRKGGKPWSGSG